MKREGTVGAPSRLIARLSTTLSAPNAMMKSCALWPMRRSGGHQAELRAHRAIEKGAGVRLRRPYAFVESGEQDEIGVDEPRFQRTEDLQARMGASRAAQHRLDGDAVEERRVVLRVKACRRLSVREPIEEFEQRRRALFISLLGAGDHGFERGACARARSDSDAVGVSAAKGEKAASIRASASSIARHSSSLMRRAAGCACGARATSRAGGDSAPPSRRQAARMSRSTPISTSGASDATLRARESEARVSGWASSAATFTAPARSDPIVATSRASAPMRCPCERHAARIVDLNVEASQLGGDAPRDRAVRRDERRRAAGRLQRLAHEERERQRLESLVRRFQRDDAVERLLRSRRSAQPDSRAMPTVASAGAIACETNARRAASAGVTRASSRGSSRAAPMAASKRFNIVCGWVKVGSRLCSVQPTLAQDVRAHDLIEARQDHGAIFEPGDGGEQPRGRRLRAGGAERDHRRGRRRAGKLRDLRFNEAFLIGAGVDASPVGENLRPFAQGDLQKFRRDRPEIAVGVVAQSIEGVDRNIFDVQFVDEGAEFGGQRIGGRRRRCDEKRFALMQTGRAACYRPR